MHVLSQMRRSSICHRLAVEIPVLDSGLWRFRAAVGAASACLQPTARLLAAQMLQTRQMLQFY